MVDPEIQAIDAEMKKQGRSRADLGRLLGLDSAQVSRIFSGARRMQRHEHARTLEWLGLSNAPTQNAGGSIVAGPGMVPLYGWVGATSHSRLTFAEQNLRGFVPMHPNQLHSREAFALEVADVSMSPRYEPGEIIYVAPNRWPRSGQDCVVVTTEAEGLLKRFVRREDDKIILYQLNPEQNLELELVNVSAIHAVVGRG